MEGPLAIYALVLFKLDYIVLQYKKRLNFDYL